MQNQCKCYVNSMQILCKINGNILFNYDLTFNSATFIYIRINANINFKNKTPHSTLFECCTKTLSTGRFRDGKITSGGAAESAISLSRQIKLFCHWIIYLYHKYLLPKGYLLQWDKQYWEKRPILTNHSLLKSPPLLLTWRACCCVCAALSSARPPPPPPRLRPA